MDLEMKLFYKLIILALIGSLAAPFIVKGPDGKPLMDYKDLVKSFSPSKEFKQAISGGQPQLYRYQNEKGQWQYTDTPPDSVQAQTVKLNKQAATLKTIELPEGYRETQPESRFDPLEKSSGLPLTTAPLEKVPEMLEQIDGIQKKLDNRQSQIDAASR